MTLVLMYHRVEESGRSLVNDFSDVFRHKGTVITTEDLIEDILFLQGSGWHHVPLSEFGIAREQIFHLTFDDGYIEHINVVAPLLVQLGITDASFYVATGVLHSKPILPPLDLIYYSISHRGLPGTLEAVGEQRHLRLDSALNILKSLTNVMHPAGIRSLPHQLGLTDKELSKIREQFMGEQEIRRLGCLGFTIGSHGVTHRDYRYYRSVSLQELKRSKTNLEALIGTSVENFAFPDGQYDAILREQCMKVGYHQALAIRSHWDDGYVIPRVFATPSGAWRREVTWK